MFGLKEKEWRELQDIIKKNNIEKAIVFGSRAKGNFAPGSDVDLAIIGDETKLSYALNEESHLIYYFDVLNLNKIANPNLKAHIDRVGIPITNASQQALTTVWDNE